MNDNTKIEVAREIMNAMIAMACKDGFDPNDSLVRTLLREEDQMNAFDFEVIDKILNVYAPLVKQEGK